MGIFDFLKKKSPQQQTQDPETVAPESQIDNPNIPPTIDSVTPPPAPAPTQPEPTTPQTETGQVPTPQTTPSTQEPQETEPVTVGPPTTPIEETPLRPAEPTPSTRASTESFDPELKTEGLSRTSSEQAPTAPVEGQAPSTPMPPSDTTQTES